MHRSRVVAYRYGKRSFIDVGDVVSRTRKSSYTITNESNSRSIGSEEEAISCLPSRTGIEAVFVVRSSARSREGQNDISSSEVRLIWGQVSYR